jgi:hypothetical protein
VYPAARGEELSFGPGDLDIVLDRLRAAVHEDLRRPGPPVAQLTAAWTRVAELRLPRTIAPLAVLDEVERLVSLWDRQRGPGGIARAASALTADEVAAEADRLRAMLAETERIAAGLEVSG